MSSSAKRSGVWKYFVEVDKNKSKCNLCGVHLSRGGVGKTATTSTMKKHLQTKHKSEYDKVFGEAELGHYLSVPRAARDANPYKWWVSNKGHYPILGKVAAQFLSTPASSVYSERLFSEAGLIYEAKRSKLDPNRAEKLEILHHNLPLLNFNY
ncbi:Zinc finger BED domain-containing protein 4 [Operophtera brumata]|uniref:Zinc finger BED domain-containing protein 4 n=1 Tax=Operophtera brumata TaxID=104452 RepID=A0A0L7LD71_OPEBR|nr:Zinc finger BED domain-containing protein 4 [Operophtera brumata]